VVDRWQQAQEEGARPPRWAPGGRKELVPSFELVQQVWDHILPEIIPEVLEFLVVKKGVILPLFEFFPVVPDHPGDLGLTVVVRPQLVLLRTFRSSRPPLRR